jgi:7-cyano-7-deazaguanine reductase
MTRETSAIQSGVEGVAPAIAQEGSSDRGHTLDVFAAPSNSIGVDYVSDEVSAMCPITGQPDWYKVRIILYSEARLYLESKALKLYLQSFREEGMFCEAFAARIASDVSEAVQAPCRVTLVQKPRGGVSIEATARGGVKEDVGSE